MIEHEFRADSGGAGRHVQYFREFEDGEGRLVRITLIFEPPRKGYGPKLPRFAGAQVTVSKFWGPMDKASLAANAPESAREILGEVYARLEEICGDGQVSLVERSCSICGFPLSTFREGPDGPTCLEPLSCDRATL